MLTCPTHSDLEGGGEEGEREVRVRPREGESIMKARRQYLTGLGGQCPPTTTTPGQLRMRDITQREKERGLIILVNPGLPNEVSVSEMGRDWPSVGPSV